MPPFCLGVWHARSFRGALVPGGGRDLEERCWKPAARRTRHTSVERDFSGRCPHGALAGHQPGPRALGARLDGRCRTTLDPGALAGAQRQRRGATPTGMPGGSSSSPWPQEHASQAEGREARTCVVQQLRRVARAARGIGPHSVCRQGYRRLPEITRAPAPLVGIAGLDSRKEDIAARTDAYIKRGIGIFAVDLPGTGESPVAAAAPDSDRIFSAALDYFAARPDVNAKRMVVQGRSWSGYWAAKLAATERDRLRGAVVHGGPIHHYFQPDWLASSLANWRISLRLSGGEMRDARGVGPGRSCSTAQRFSARRRPARPAIRTDTDRQRARLAVPIADAILLLERGTAKDAWINPQGGHMGRSPEWPVA